MPQLGTYGDVDALLDAWKDRVAAMPGATPLAALSTALGDMGTTIPVSELRFAFRDMGDPHDIPAAVFRDHAIPVMGSDDLRRAHAFDHLCGGADGLETGALAASLERLGLARPEAEAIAAELDRDGDARVTLADVAACLHGHDASVGYRATHVRRERLGRDAETPAGPPPAPGDPRPRLVTAKPPPPTADDAEPTAALFQMQIGFFRLLQGAAYRSFRENYAAHSETHLRARDLPYTLPDFVTFVDAAVDLHLRLGLVDPGGPAEEFRTLARLVQEEKDRLDARIADWSGAQVTPEMAAAEAAIAAARAEAVEHRRLLSDALEMILVLRMHGIAPQDFDPGRITQHELNRLRHEELAGEHGRHDTARRGAAPAAWLDAWTPVIVSADDERPDGAIMPVRFWYERFMPQLLRCASIRTGADLAAARAPDAAALAAWHRETAARGAFDRYAQDLRDGFADCTPGIQQALAQAWRLTEPYLNGLEKRREREEFGRETGALSQYVAFIDVFLGRSDVAEAEMRVSFPYYIGPAVWAYMHTAAELIEAMEDTGRAAAIDAFKRFFRAFATMYPCPYCRYHLNRFVVRNLELNFYPVEFMLLGQREDRRPFDIGLEDRLATIDAGRPGTLRLFLWKLHNAVSSSIARTEPWYHREVEPLYTTRFWPGLDAEIARVRALGQTALPLERLEAIWAALKPAAHLAVHRQALQEALAEGDAARVERLITRARHDIAALETAIEASGHLRRSYLPNPEKEPASVTFSLPDEAYARSGFFVER
ncbi:MAG: hypothetical protein ACOCY0_00135 [Roseicyclus sp.]